MSVILQFDGGNSRLKWRLLSKGRVQAHGVEKYDGLDVQRFVDHFLSLDVDRVHCAAVKISSLLNEVMCRFEEVLGSVSVVEITHAMLERENYAYVEFERMGIDRCLAIEGAKRMSSSGRAFLVIDGGSALTADYVDREGRHIGGYIFPGVLMLRSSLLSGTSKVHVNNEVDLSYEPGVTTEQCVSHAMDVLLKSTLDCLQSRLCGEGVIYMTGGDAQVLARYLEHNLVIKSDLIFEGMSAVMCARGDEI